MSETEEKGSDICQEPSITTEHASSSTAEQLDTDRKDRKPPSRPIRMMWGRVVEEPPEEPAEVPPETKEAEKSAPPPKPDPRIEALREKLAREEQAEREARIREEREKKEAEARRLEEETVSSENRKKRTKPHKIGVGVEKRPSVLKKAPVPPKIERSSAENGRRENTPDVRSGSEEDARMREELEHAELLRRIRKKRRREALRDFGAAILGGIWTLFRKIRISKKLAIGLLLTVLLSGLSAVILGNLLKARVGTPGDDAESTEAPETEGETAPSARGLEIPTLNAGIVSLEGATAQSLRSEAQRFANAGVTAVSLILRDGDGALLFSAQTDDGLGKEPEDTGRLLISEILEPFHQREIYVSCIFPMRYFTDGDDYSRSVLYAYETALLSEIAEAGADEVVLLDCDGLFDCITDENTGESGSAFSAADAVRELTEIARSVNERAPLSAVGIAFSPAFLETRDSDRYLGSIVEAFDLLLLDLRGAENTDDLYSEVSQGVSDHLYFILRYSMRVLIPQGSAEAVTRVSVDNWQEGTLSSVTTNGSE